MGSSHHCFSLQCVCVCARRHVCACARARTFMIPLRMILNSFHKSKLLFLHYVQPDIFSKNQQTNLGWGIRTRLSDWTDSNWTERDVWLGGCVMCYPFPKCHLRKSRWITLWKFHQEDRFGWWTWGQKWLGSRIILFWNTPVTPPREARSTFLSNAALLVSKPSTDDSFFWSIACAAIYMNIEPFCYISEAYNVICQLYFN